MSATPSLHVVQRADGVWQVEREDDVVPQSVHADREEALDAALAVARREHRPLQIHRTPRRAARWVDRVAWAVLDEVGREPVAGTRQSVRPARLHVRRRAS